jgi:splicing factor 4
MSVCIGGTSTSASKSTGSYQSLQQQHSNYQIPASALYDDAEELKGSMSTSSGRTGNSTYQYAMDIFENFVSIDNP